MKKIFISILWFSLLCNVAIAKEVNIEQQIDLLYHQKNYSQDNNNTVFILHPDKNAIKNPRTPTKWGDDSFYGETDITHFNWDDNKYPNHKYGAILLSPIDDSGKFLDNLQRLIGLAMQYNIENNDDIAYRIAGQRYKAINPIPKEEIFCLVCGSDNCNISIPLRASEKYSDRWRYKVKCQEKNCGHSFEYNYCWKCKHRLIKNGRYWSYHSLQILNEFDVRCPNCNRLLNER